MPKSKRILLALLCVLAMGSAFSNVAYADELPETMYTTTDAYLYESVKTDSTILGVIKSNSKVHIEAVESDMVQVLYDNIAGYVKISDLGTTFQSYVTENEDINDTSVTTVIDADHENLLPVSHYMAQFDTEENAAITRYFADGDSTDNYVILSDASNIKLYNFTVKIAGMNECEAIYLSYGAGRDKEAITMKIPVWKIEDTADDMSYCDLSFTYESGVIKFLNADALPAGITVGTYGTDEDTWKPILKNSELEVKSAVKEIEPEIETEITEINEKEDISNTHISKVIVLTIEIIIIAGIGLAAAVFIKRKNQNKPKVRKIRKRRR